MNHGEIMGGFLKMGVSQNGWLTRENPTKRDENWGYPYDSGNPQISVHSQSVNSIIEFGVLICWQTSLNSCRMTDRVISWCCLLG